ncbi:histidine kinase [Anaerocolumna sp. AGMB13025]|uniref:sensor histidine kinase n=1 Tax=Anaerocolumna sp. AGMB13025 TaxID=3039116 RepID=UPI00241BFFCD|nr:histidine kinase [Anaerocolumna sp. AGMB13025]WFR57626.1 histidine kinase [Anaerocolumna sp. AGMB13025]
MHVNTYNAAKKTYSFRSRMFTIICLIFLSFILIIGWLSSYFTSVLREKTYDNLKDTLELYNHQLSDSLEELDIYLYEMNSYSSDISSISYMGDVNYIYNNIMRAKDLLDYSLPAFSEIGGLFIYAPINDTFIQSHKLTNDALAADYLRTYLRSLNASSNLDEINIKTWFTKEINNSYYLIRILRINNTYLGAWANVDQLTSTFKNIAEHGGNVIYVTEGGVPLCENKLSGYTFDVESSLNNYSIFTMNDKSKALLVTNELDYCDYYLLALIPLKNIDMQLYTIYQILLIMAVFIIILTLFLLISVSKFLSRPLFMLENAAVSIRLGNFEQKVTADASNCREIIEIDTAFNNMIDEIHNLRVDIYEEKLAKSQIELQYLKSQIAPHFLINCLCSIGSMAADISENQEVLPKMIQTLSDHLRYTLSDRTTVALKEELLFIYNYIELTKIRFPDCLTYESHIAAETEEASVFPLILLMFTENTIKYNMVMGEPLQIKITSYMIEKENKKWIHLTHIDSGDGFSSDILGTLEDINNKKPSQKDGRHLGVHNVAKRLALVYGETAVIHFSNEPGSGARIDIEIPYIPFQQ